MLRYEAPQNFTRSAASPPEDYTANEFTASVQIYPFRPLTGNVEQIFQQTMFRDWVDARYRERVLNGSPEFRKTGVRGADAAFTARFSEMVGGIPSQRLRMAIVSKGMVAVVDAKANSLETWQRAIPILNKFSASIRVEANAAGPSVAPPKVVPQSAVGGTVAGLYRGTKPKYKVNLNRGVGNGDWVTAQHYYLFSADGRVYRAYDQIHLPSDDPARFDFEAARRTDPNNTGRYAVVGNQLRIQMMGQPPEMIVAAVPKDGRAIIQTILYVKER